MDCLPCEKQPGLVSQAKLCINKQFTVQHTSSGEGRVLWKSGETAASQSWPDFIVFSFCSAALTGKDHPTLFLSLPALLSSCPPPQKPDDVQAPQSRTFKRYHYHFKEPAAVLQTYKPWYAIAIATNCVITLYCFIAKWWPAPACYTCQTVGGPCSVAIRKKKSMLCASAIVAADPVKHRCFLSVFQTKACFGFFSAVVNYMADMEQRRTTGLWRYTLNNSQTVRRTWFSSDNLLPTKRGVHTVPKELR